MLSVMAKVWKGCTFGIIAKTVSPTKPLELDAMPDSFMGRSNPVFPATGVRRDQKYIQRMRYENTHVSAKLDLR